MAATTYGDIGQRTAYWAATTMLAHAEPILVLQKTAQHRPIPKNKANQVKFRRPIPFAVDTTPLVEGVTPTAHKMRYEDVPVTLAQYGDVVEITDVVNDTAEDPVLTDASMLSGEQAAETMEMITYGAIKAGTNKFYGNGTARTAVNTAISLNKQHAVIRSLNSNRAKKHTRILDGSVNISTKPIEASFIAYCHTDCEHDIRALTGFTPVAEYGSRKPICPEELGSVENVRYVCSPLLEPYIGGGSTTQNGMKWDGTNVDVYPVIVVGMDSYGCVPLKGKEAMTPRVINPDTVDKSDPLGQRGYVSWKSYFACKVLNESWMAVLEVGVTEL